MKRSILDITKKLYRSNNRIVLDVYDLTDSTYYIFRKNGYRFSSIIREMSSIDGKKLVRVTVNNVFIPNDDFVIESDNNSITVKLIRNRFEYGIDNYDVVVLNASIENA